ncbi:MAG: type IV pilus modification protein PilV [Pseudomonadota bacterium]
MPVTRRQQRPVRSRQRGYTLLEILVAAIILTGGLIGLASMQASGTRLNNSAYLRTQASILAYDIADRMRANRAAVVANSYDIALTDATPGSPTTVADIDLVQWRNALAYYLPAGNGSIETVAGATPDAPQRATITVQWNDGRAAADVIDFALTTDL